MSRRRAGLTLAALAALSGTKALSDPLHLEPGKEVSLACTTQSVVMLPTAAGSHGTFTLRLELKAEGAPAGSTWSVGDVSADHKDSFAVRDKVRCSAGCELIAPQAGRFELWSPKKAAAGSLGEGEVLTVIAIDPLMLKLHATSVLGKEIAAFEQGTCTVAAP